MASERLERVIALLVCPTCRGELTRGPKHLDCLACRRRYPIIDDIPRMVPEESREIELRR